MTGDDLRRLYQEVILDHGRAPRNFGRPACATHEAEGYNPLCGDMVSVFLSVADDGTVENAAFDGRGCALSIASASLMTELLKGRSVDDAQSLFTAFRALCTGEGDDEPRSIPDPIQGTPPAPPPGADPLESVRVFEGVRAFPSRARCATLPWYTMRAALAGEAEATSE